jgi:phage-related protein
MVNAKPIAWLSGEVKSPPFSKAARIEAGFLLRRLQNGEMLSLPHSRPMPVIGRRCHELRIPDNTGTWRIVYFVDEYAIVVLDVFSKKTQTMPKPIIEACRKRLKEYLE